MVQNKRNGKIALVTGASKGIGKAITNELVTQGYTVIGTCRNPQNLEQSDRINHVEYLSMDLTDEISIYQVINSIDKVDVLVNNAGASQMGAVEEVPIQKIRELMELNYFGHVCLTKGILPKMRKQGGGTIINITSLAGHIPVPFSSLYAAGKMAMETFSHGLRSEVARFGIRVVAVAPSFIKTGIYQEKICPDDSIYKKYLDAAKRIRDNGIEKGTYPEKIAKEIAGIIGSKRPAPFYAVGSNSRILSLMSRILPRKIIESGTQKRFRLD